METALSGKFSGKDDARRWVWDRLVLEGIARPPFPAHGRIPNFQGAKDAARRLFEHPPWRDARFIKVSPDSPQRWVRLAALELGKIVLVPTPKLAGGFFRLDPARIPASRFSEAALRQTMGRWAEPVALDDLPQLDAIVAGSVAVTATGKRCGKGAGYSDLEYAMLLELGHRPAPVATTVADRQVVDDFPEDATDLPLALICTPTRSVAVAAGRAGPAGIQWGRLSPVDLEAMPVLEEVRRRAPDELI